jgi:hypothetical protein
VIADAHYACACSRCPAPAFVNTHVQQTQADIRVRCPFYPFLPAACGSLSLPPLSAHRVCFCRLPPPPDSHPTEASPFLQPQKAATLPSSPIISSGTPRWPSHSQADQGALPLISLNSRALGGGVFCPVSRACHLACSLSFMRTALHLAACEGHFHICELLLQNGADVNAMDEE